MTPVNIAEQLTRLPAQPFAATLILRLLEDEEASLAELGRLIEMDPALSARVIRLANSPYYHLRDSVTSASRAVILLGVDAVRAVAASAAMCLLENEVNLGPADYWAHSISVAAGASVSAEALGVSTGEAFSAGLLHDIGTALLHRGDPARYDALYESAPPGGLCEAELSEFGVTHCDAGAEALATWHFPKAFVRAIASHHSPITAAAPLGQAIILGEALAERLDPLRTAEVQHSLEHLMAELGIAPNLRTTLLERTRRQLAEITKFVGARR
jgi:putative nucleotidyltransferase with HDIG domain